MEVGEGTTIAIGILIDRYKNDEDVEIFYSSRESLDYWLEESGMVYNLYIRRRKEGNE